MEMHVGSAEVFVNPLASFKTQADRELLSLYQEGYTFMIWRGSTPWNKYLRKPGTEGSHDVHITQEDTSVTVSTQDFVRLGKPVQVGAHGTITRSLSKREIGLSFKDAYVFDQSLLDTAMDTWERVEREIAAQSEHNWGDACCDLNQLSAEALSLVKLMHPRQRFNQARLFPYLELMPFLEELKQHGIIELARNSQTYWYQLRAPYAQGPIPKVKKMKLKFGVKPAAPRL